VEHGSSVDRPQEPPPPAEPYARVLKPGEFGATRRVTEEDVDAIVIGGGTRAKTVFVGY
jgi:hypothetical protein